MPRPLPIRIWQVWNEANFFYFAFPVSPSRYAKLLKLTYPAIKAADPGAKVILSGLFGDPDRGGRAAWTPPTSSTALYRVPGIKRYFDADRPAPVRVPRRRPRRADRGDARRRSREPRPGAAPLHHRDGLGLPERLPTSSPSSRGSAARSRELRSAYRYLIANRHRLNLKGTYWFSWKDIQGALQLLRLGRPLPRRGPSSAQSPPGAPSSASPAAGRGRSESLLTAATK